MTPWPFFLIGTTIDHLRTINHSAFMKPTPSSPHAVLDPDLKAQLRYLEDDRKQIRGWVALVHGIGILVLAPWILSIVRNTNYEQILLASMWLSGWWVLVTCLTRTYNKACQISFLRALGRAHGLPENSDEISIDDVDESHLFSINIHSWENQSVFETSIGDSRLRLIQMKTKGLVTPSENMKLLIGIFLSIEYAQDPIRWRVHERALRNPSPHVIFQGMFGKATFSQSFSGLTRIHSSPLRRFFGTHLGRSLQNRFSRNMILVTTPYKEFEKRFVVRSNTPTQAEKILSPEFARALTQLQKRTRKKMAFSFSRQGACFAISCVNAMARPPLWSTLNNDRWIRSSEALFQALIAWVETLHTQQSQWAMAEEERSRLDQLEDVLATMR